MKRDYLLPNKFYDILNVLVKIFIPGIGALYYSLSGIWGLPKGDEVVGTCAAVATFFGLFLVLANWSYNKSDSKYDGELKVEHSLEQLDPDDTELAQVSKYGFVGDMTPEELAQKDQILFKVNHINKS